ncbi:MAG: hypothetical protein ACKVP0_17685 [Pirellulaceae bacterium]
MKGPWILLGIGGVLLLLSGAVALVSMLLPALTNGKASPEEALMGVIPGCCCSALSLAMVIGGVIWLVIASNQNRQR